jgi:hypothetical protein
MLYHDRVFGDFTIIEPLILDLINSPSMQRLKGVDQSGYFEPFYPGSAHSRFEHSVGVYFILNKFNAPLPEQAAGLIHDVSHSAFSHCLDYLENKKENGKNQSHQDSIHDNFVEKSELPTIFARHGLDIEYILNDANFPLKERPLPNLCADRIDYSLRGGVHFGAMSEKEAIDFLNHLIAKDNYWLFVNQDWAKKYAELFSKINNTFYSGIESAHMLQSVADFLAHALTNDYINHSDLYTTDTEVLNKIKPHLDHDLQLQKLFARMENRVPYRHDPANFDVEVLCKARPIDPLFINNEKTHRLSEVDEDWQKTKLQDSQTKQYFIKFADSPV